MSGVQSDPYPSGLSTKVQTFPYNNFPGRTFVDRSSPRVTLDKLAKAGRVFKRKLLYPITEQRVRTQRRTQPISRSRLTKVTRVWKSLSQSLITLHSTCNGMNQTNYSTFARVLMGQPSGCCVMLVRRSRLKAW